MRLQQRKERLKDGSDIAFSFSLAILHVWSCLFMCKCAVCLVCVPGWRVGSGGWLLVFLSFLLSISIASSYTMKIICFMYVSAINCTHIHSSFSSPLFVYFCCPITPSERTQWFWVLLQSFYNDKTNLGLTRSKGTHSQSWSIIIYPFNKCLQHSTPYFLYRQLCSFRVYIAQCFVPHTQSYVYTVGLMCVFGPLHKPGIAMLCFLRIMMTLYTFLIEIIPLLLWGMWHSFLVL